MNLRIIPPRARDLAGTDSREGDTGADGYGEWARATNSCDRNGLNHRTPWSAPMVPVAFVRAPYACNGTLDYIINGRESYARDIIQLVEEDDTPQTSRPRRQSRDTTESYRRCSLCIACGPYDLIIRIGATNCCARSYSC